MNVMAQQTLRSPVSPFTHQSKQSFAGPQQQQHRQSYPSSPNPQALSPQHASVNRGLGLFTCSLPPSQSPLTASPQQQTWSNQSMLEADYSQQSQPPDIFSAAFDPFSGFPSSSNTGMVGAHSPEAPGLEFCSTPPSSNMPSHRSSVSSSYAASEAFSHSGSDCAYTPRVKVEEAGGEWYPSAGNEHVLQRALSSQGPLTYTAGPNTLGSQPEDIYRAQPTEWSKNDTAGYLTELHASPDGQLPRFSVQPILPSVSRIKKKRQRTTPEEATHECRVCGKLFKRSYNWKSHMETHNPERKYPHPCTAMVGNNACTKKFQRKTDLDRHYDSVHLKARNHKCSLCGNRFARRDTLRRHTEDGCPKRFELGIREASAYPTPNPSASMSSTSSLNSASLNPSTRWGSFSSYPPRPRSYSVGVPMSSPMAPPGSATSTATFPLFTTARPGFEGQPQLTNPVYPSS
ncbi:hypothetical protein MMC19_002237 [Ptychographa xylographoides]|nr:hypothetical protein [Ptychographa xylographoides]